MDRTIIKRMNELKESIKFQNGLLENQTNISSYQAIKHRIEWLENTYKFNQEIYDALNPKITRHTIIRRRT